MMNNIKRYGKVFIAIIAIMIILLLMEKVMPSTRSRINITKSEKYYQEYYKKNSHKSENMQNDLIQLSIIYLENNKNYYSEMIEMVNDSKTANKIINHKSIKTLTPNSDYSRYWNGNIILLKPLLTFFTMNVIYIIYSVIFILLFCFLLFKVFKHSKLLAIALLLSSLLLNIFVVTKYTTLMIIFIISMITSIILLNKYEKKDNNIDLLLLVTGMLTSFFNLSTCGTISLTLPLFIYIYINYKDKKSIKVKEVIKPVLLWLFGFFATTIVKWILLTIHYNGDFVNKVLIPSKKVENILLVINNNIGTLSSYIINILIFVSILVCILLPIIDKKNKNYYLLLIGISIIPIIRLIVLIDNLIILLPLIMLWILLDIKLLSLIKNKKVIT